MTCPRCQKESPGDAGHRAESKAISERARAAGEEIGDLHAQISANTNLGLAAFQVGDYRQAQAFQEANLRLIPSHRFRDRLGRPLLPSVSALSQLAGALGQRGVFDEAVRHGAAAIELAQEVGHPYSLAIACFHVGRVHTLRGAAAQARPFLSEARALAEELTIRSLMPAVALELSALSVLEGQARNIFNRLQEARVAIEELNLGPLEVLAELRMGEALLAAGRFDEARAAAEHALDLARERGEQGHEAWTLRLLGELAAHPHATATDVAESHYRDALALAERLGMRPLVAHCHLGLGKLYGRAGDPAKAHEYLTSAATMYREMGMDFWLEKAAGALKEVG
jgi:tetratricopeptide (TPR) repeat protein